MPWGSFSTTHLLTLALVIAVNVLICLVLKRNTRTKQILSLFVFSLIGIACLIGGILLYPGEWIKHLPLTFWGLNIILLPFAVLSRGKRICNLLLIWSAGSIIALVFNTNMAHLDVLSFEFLYFFIMHMFGAGIPILLFELGLVRRDTHTVKPTLITTFAVYTVVHWVNLAINSANNWSVNSGVNYMSTLAPTSPLLRFLYTVMPADYWYMVLVLPIVLLYVLYWYLPEILDNRRSKHPLREKLRDIDKYYDEYAEEYIDDIIDKKYKK